MDIAKRIYIDKNYNGKLACSAMVHIDMAPRSKIPESVMWGTLVEIHTSDHSHPPTLWRLVDFIRIEAGQLTNIFTLPSHGMDSADFWQYAKSLGYNGGSQLAVYYYQRHV